MHTSFQQKITNKQISRPVRKISEVDNCRGGLRNTSPVDDNARSSTTISASEIPHNNVKKRSSRDGELKRSDLVLGGWGGDKGNEIISEKSPGRLETGDQTSVNFA